MRVLSIQGLNLTINGEQRIKDSSFDVSSGDVILLTGPNGCGKSTVIKIVMGAIFRSDSDITYDARNITYYREEKEYNLKSEKDLELFRQNVGYVSQEDFFEADSVLECFESSLNYAHVKDTANKAFSFVKAFSLAKFFGIKTCGRLTGRSKYIAKKLSLKDNILSEEDELAVKYLSMSVRKMSGGQKKLTNIFTNLIRYEFSNLIILDEPLNNLDYNNVRLFSNVLTQIHVSKPELAIILVTHCRSIPIVNKVIEIRPETCDMVVGESFVCSSCFGKINEDGFYQ